MRKNIKIKASVLVMLIVLVAVSMLSGCIGPTGGPDPSTEAKLVGKWVYNPSGSGDDFVYLTFNADKTGSREDGSVTKSFTYLATQILIVLNYNSGGQDKLSLNGISSTQMKIYVEQYGWVTFNKV